MSDVLLKAASALNERLEGSEFSGSIRFDVEDEGYIRVDDTGASVNDEEADTTLSASLETFQEMIDGELNPTSAFMSGKLKVSGDMGLAMKLGSILS